MNSVSKLSQVQLLRAIAVILVVGFHAQIPLFNFGYLGVDIFFVISGFLMGYLYPSFRNRFDFMNFWSRRLLRLLPAFIFVNILFLILLFSFLLPFEREKLLEQLTSSSIFISNFHFWSQEQYFATESLRPFLHTWSLSIEAQFYLLFPLLVFLSYKKRRFQKGLFFASLISFLVINTLSPNSAFFLLPFRLWEFSAGLLLSIHFVPNKYELTKTKRLIVIGLSILVFISFELLNISQGNSLPNIIAVLFTLLFIREFTNYEEHHGLFMRVMQLIGNRSYVIYLVHFPLLILLNYRPFNGNILGIDSLQKGLFYIFLLSIISEFIHRNIEFLRIPKFHSQTRLYVFSSALIIVCFYTLTHSQFITLGIDQRTLAISDSQKDRTQFRCGTLARIQFLPNYLAPNEYCALTTKGRSFSAILIGNSHADAIKESVENVVENLGGSLYLAQENMNVNRENRSALVEIVKSLDVDLVILHSRWSTYDWVSLNLLIDSLDNGKRSFLLLGPVPEYDFAIPERMLIESASFKNALNSEFFNSKFRDDLQKMRILDEMERLQFVSLIGAFCSPVCQLSNSLANPYYFDSNHLTLTGAREIEPILKGVLLSMQLTGILPSK